MSRIYEDADADLAVVQERNVTLLGDGDQTLAQALCLRDSGVDVRLGLRGDAPTRGAADGEGLRVLAPYEACEESDVVVMLGDIAGQPALYEEAVQPNLVAGDALLFGHGAAVRFGVITPPDGVDVALVRPLGVPAEQRRQYEHGRGVPVLVAVERDASGSAWSLVLSYAKAIGGTRAGALETTLAEEAEAATFAELVVGDGVPALLSAAFDTLVASGCQPETAYLQCLDAFGRAARLVTGDRQAADGSPVIDDSTRAGMRRLLDAIAGGQHAPAGTTDRSGNSRLQTTGQHMRRLLGWPRPTRGDA